MRRIGSVAPACRHAACALAVSGLVVAAAAAAAPAQGAGDRSRGSPLAAFSAAAGAEPPAPWRLVTLPKIPRHTRYRIEELEGQRVLRMQADASYASLLHPLDHDTAAAPVLQWRWRVEQLVAGADLTRREGDDTPARLCVLFDVPAARLAFGVRMQLRLGRALFDPQLPAASICYVWDGTLAPGTWLPNAHTERVQMLVLRRGEPGRWHAERRDLRADFARAFPAEAAGGFVPRVVGVAIAADGDNTGGTALAWFGDIRLLPEQP
jgi:hypothetical protein